MKSIATFLVAALAVSAPALAQGRNIAGTWVLDVAKTGAPAAGAAGRAGGPPKMFIKQTPKDISIAMGAETNIVTFNLDGSGAEQKMGKSKMEWKGDKFVATVSATRDGKTITNALTFYREGAWLVVENPAHDGAGIEKMYYAKATDGK
jgi:hypothetical protein